MTISTPATKNKRPIRSFVIRNRPGTKQEQILNGPGAEYLWQPPQAADKEKSLNLQTIFPKQQPLIIEIGFGMGESLITEMQNNPSFNYLGIEVHPPGVARLIKAAEETQTKNIRLAMHDAVTVIDKMADAQADKIQIFFPDPWPKARHHKRRLINPGFIELLIKKLKTNACLHIATDHTGYAAHIKEVLDQFPTLKEVSDLDSSNEKFNQDIIKSSMERPTTKYERRGLKLGHPINDFIMLKI